MKRWIWLLLLAVGVMLLPEGQGTDVAELTPVEVLYIYIEGSKIGIATDTEAFGTGYSLESAIEDMKETAYGEVFLDTADYVLMTEQTKGMILELRDSVRLSAKLLVATGEVDLKRVPQFLKVQKPKVTLRDYLTGETAVPKLMSVEGRYYID